MTPPIRNTRRRPFRAPADIPLLCDFHCSHAAFAPEDATGACRREQAVFCRVLGVYNAKNGPCAARQGGLAERKSKRHGRR